MSATTAQSPTKTTTITTNSSSTNPPPANIKSHVESPPGDLSPLSESNCATSSPLFSGCGPHDDSVAVGNETMFGAGHDPNLMSTPVKGDDANDGESPPVETNPLSVLCDQQQSTPLLGVVDEEEDIGEFSSVMMKDCPTLGKRKRDSMESIDCSMVMPTEGRVTRSVKRLKRFNTTAKGLRRNLSFNAMKSPFTNLLRRGRSAALDTSITNALNITDLTEPDCGAAIQEAASIRPNDNNNKSPTFKTPKALPPINHHHAAAAGAVVRAPINHWRTRSQLVNEEDSGEIEGGGGHDDDENEEDEEEDSIAVIEPEGKSAPDMEETHPGVEKESYYYY